MINLIPPILPYRKPSVFKVFWELFKNIFTKTSKDAGGIEAITSESTIEDISKINEIFCDFKESVENQATEIEKKVVVEVSDYADELCFLVESGDSLLSKYNININRFKRQIEKLKNSISGTMQKEISKKISLDNPDCKKAIKMLPGVKKEEEFKLLLMNAINSGVGAINEKVEMIIADIIDDFEYTLNNGIELIEKNVTVQMNLLTEAELKSNEFVQIKEIIKSNAKLTICSCELIENTVGTEV